MKCPACGDLGANEINISVNVSECNPGVEKEYSGDTDFAPDCLSNQLGVYCNACDTQTLDQNWQTEVVRYLTSQTLPFTVNTGVALDAASIRTEIEDRSWDGDDDEEAATAAAAAMTDTEINDLIRDTVDDAFWQAYDDTRSTVINRMITHNTKDNS